MAVVLMGVGILLCAIAPIYGVLFLALMIAGLGEGVIEGLGTPFVQALHTDEPGRYINFSHAFWSIGVLVTVLITGVFSPEMSAIGYAPEQPVPYSHALHAGDLGID